MNDIAQLHAALEEWNAALDAGDIDKLMRTVHPDVIVCNENQATTTGIAAMRSNYAQRITHYTFNSTVDVQQIALHGDTAIMVLDFRVETTHKSTGESGVGAGRLVLVYRRNDQGAWQVVLDVDNNGAAS